jgi:ubiquinone/menaquinone biosynthesis C-methylase UbiE
MHERRFNHQIERLRDPQRVKRLEVERVVNLTLEGLERPQSVLDVGVGSGLFAQAFSARGLATSGVDANPQMLAVAQQFVPGGSFQEGIAEALPAADQSVDVVFMGLVLHETDDPLQALQEAHRVARIRLAVLEWPDEVTDFGPPAEHRISSARLVQLAHQAGFQHVDQLQLEYLTFYRMTP